MSIDQSVNNDLKTLTSNTISVEILVALEEAYMKVQIIFVIIVTIRLLSREVTVSRLIVLVGNHPKIPPSLLENGKPRIMLYKIIKVQKNPPQPATSIYISGVNIEIMSMRCGDSTGEIITISGKRNKKGIIKLAHRCEYGYYL